MAISRSTSGNDDVSPQCCELASLDQLSAGGGELTPTHLFLGKFRRSIAGTRFLLPPPWVPVVGSSARWLYAFDLLELPEVICLTTEQFVAQRLLPVLSIPRDEPGALLVTANRASKYRPVPLDAQHRVNLTEASETFLGADPGCPVSVVLYGGGDHLGMCEESKFGTVERRLEQEEAKLSRWLQRGAAGPEAD
ncbi:MAG: hypothetical protein COZ06_11210 [Armatimonadetes bacterium CG_4_10_14_3_um_filter_66_18]|nr:hypothetical protein [Armatimonadota bacterium]OIO92667.1 MAG: hypothetical protein AUJ96_31880 [Armatimonadetes bacterium CG2_30_66_41]PIU90918.1 MAG: hypothetical protein COS65_23625 [Armatimonadetes bacterium CG06_land_8_20_14_3_00_66_21]PIX37393.1 MAG: hypothetical protein COZ57_34595 [Armatimonadetes bacterium CG_4_8_14_3_um_filter_66_20]PIY50076.1 MAG: hypothetical protein COZ06_11210 [Armatimonadetes bacterium CG_4_10_14_3_um_filter_66_18]PIZ48572.1 MAG: hypothetical protein COY42_06